MRFELFNSSNKKTKETGSPEGIKAADSYKAKLLALLMAFNALIPGFAIAEGGKDSDAENLKNKKEETIKKMNDLLANIEANGQPGRFTDKNGKFIEKSLGNTNLKGIKLEDGSLVISETITKTDENTGQKKIAGMISETDFDLDGQMDRHVMHASPDATNGNNELLALTPIDKLQENFETESMMTMMHKETLVVMDFDKNGNAIALNYQTGEKIPLNPEESKAYLEKLQAEHEQKIGKLVE